MCGSSTPAVRGAAHKRPKRHLVDPSLAAAAPRVGPDALIGDLETLGGCQSKPSVKCAVRSGA